MTSSCLILLGLSSLKLRLHCLHRALDYYLFRADDAFPSQATQTRSNQKNLIQNLGVEVLLTTHNHSAIEWVEGEAALTGKILMPQCNCLGVKTKALQLPELLDISLASGTLLSSEYHFRNSTIILKCVQIPEI